MSTTFFSVETPDYRFEVDYVPLGGDDRFYLAHMLVFRPVPSVIREMDEAWPYYRRCIDAPLFAWSEDEDAKWERFVNRYGFRYFKNLIGPDGKDHKFYLHI